MKRLQSPYSAQIELTYACNLACTHCYNEPRFSNENGLAQLSRVKKERIQTDKFVEIAEQLAKHNVQNVTLTGGEVFTVRERLYSALEALHRHRINTNINSNLTLVTEDDARRLSQYNLGIMTSLASYDSKTHDKIMGKEGSHQRTLQGINLVLANNIPITSNMVVSKHNLDQVYQTGKFVHGLGITSFSTAQAVPSNSGGNMHLKHALEREEVLEYLEQLNRIKEETGMEVRLTNPLPYCTVWESHPHLRYLVESAGCTAGRSIIQVDPYGNVKPCPMVSNSYGNILEEDLDIIWGRMSDWSEDKYVPESCQPCDLVDICKGACRVEAERMVGSLDSKHPYSVKPVKLNRNSIQHLILREESSCVDCNNSGPICVACVGARIKEERIYA